MSTSNNSYQLYEEQCLALAETIVIKSVAAAEAINTWLTSEGISDVDTLDPSTWKYYMNLAGLYHPSDTVMTVVSMDTTEEIIFSKENLRIHRATARGYAYGTRAHEDLVAQYPDQRYLIRGILYPVDLETAVTAEDGKILGYPPGYVEENEYSLISNLQFWVNAYRERYVNKAFSVSDGLYVVSWMGIQHMLFILPIMTYRLAACLTNEAHSYHVKSYLASNGFLDEYYDQLTLKQALWVYRNIDYIKNHTGRQDNFEWLIEHIMTERNLPLAEFSMRHDLSVLEEQAKPIVEEPFVGPLMLREIVAEEVVEKEYYPTIKFRKVPKNLGYNITGNDPLTLDQILVKEDSFTPDNKIFRELLKPAIKEEMENSLSGVVQTKFLESSMVDRSNNTPYTKTDILLNNWLVQAVRKQYRAFVSVVNPKTGDRIPLSVKDAFTFAWYAFCQARAIKLDVIPQVVATRVPIAIQPSVETLAKLVPSKYLTKEHAKEVLDVMPVVGDMISTEAFYNKAMELFEAAQYQRRFIASQEHFKRRSYALNMVSRIYTDQLCDLEPEGSLYSEWFAERNIDLTDWSESDFDLFYIAVVKQATGADLVTTKSLKDLQSAMVKMLSQLSSYSIQINKDINSTDVRMSDWGTVRLGDVDSRMKDKAVYEVPYLLREIHARTKDYTKFDITKVTLGNDPFVRQKTQMRFEIKVKPRSGKHSAYLKLRFRAAPVRFRPIPALQANDFGITPVMGTDLYLTFDPVARMNFVDVYDNKYTMFPPEGPPEADLPPLSSIITTTVLNGLTYRYDGPVPQTDLDKVIRNTQLPGFDKT